MKRAFTLAEIVMAISIVGFLFGITVMNISKITPDNDKAKFKKAYANIEGAVARLINNEAIYPNDEGFRNTEPIIFEGTGETIGFDGPHSKFREGIQYELNVIKAKLNCKLYKGTSSSTKCFLNEDGVVYGIPDTDFDGLGTVSNNDLGRVTPIVIYTSWKEGQNVDDHAFIIGVSYNGSIRILNSGVNCEKKPESLQCRAKEYIKSDTIKIKK